MINKFTTVYAGHIDMPDRGKEATPANERRFSDDELRGVFGKLERVMQTMDKLGYHSIWMTEHHFQHEGYKVIWDNRCVLHHAIHDYHLQRRRMERTTIASDQPFGMDAPS